MSDRAKGRLFLLTTVLLFSTGGFIIKLIPWSGISIAGARSLIGVLLHYAFFKYQGKKLVYNRKTLLGAAFVTGDIILYILAVKLTTVGNAIILENTSPIFVILISWIFLRKRPQRLDITACAIVFFGILLFFIDSLSAGNMFGNSLALMAGICYAGMALMRSLDGCDPESAFIYGFLLAGAIGLPFLIKETAFSTPVLIGITELGLLQGGLAYILFNIGTKYTPPVETSFICTMEPVLNTILVALICHEYMTVTSIIGFVIVICTVVWYSWKTGKQEEQENAQISNT